MFAALTLPLAIPPGACKTHLESESAVHRLGTHVALLETYLPSASGLVLFTSMSAVSGGLQWLNGVGVHPNGRQAPFRCNWRTHFGT
jgi:hypothetical protein